jgi:hypothetical protein
MAGSSSLANSAGASGMNASAGRSAAAAGRGASGSAGKPSDSSGSAGASAMKGELFTDNFEDGDLSKPSWIDAEPDLKGMWTVVSSEGGKVLAQTASVDDWVIAVAGDYRWTDQVVEAKVKLTSEPGKAGVFARVRDLENYYFLYLDGGSNIVLRKRVDNSSSDVQKVKVETKQDVWYTLKLSVIGDKLEGSLDGKPLVSGSDAAVKTGGIGVGTSDCTAHFDYVTVRN